MAKVPTSEGGGSHVTTGYAIAEVKRATEAANAECEYYVDPNQLGAGGDNKGPTEPAADPKSGSLMIGEDTGGQMSP